MAARLERDEIRLGHDDGPFVFSCPGRNAARVLRAGAHSTLHGVVFAICVRTLRCTTEEALRCVRDPRSSVLRAYGESIQFQAIML